MRNHRTAIQAAAAFLVLLAMLLAALGVSADTVILKSGHRFEGKILDETADKVVLQMQYGTMEFKRAKVKEIKKDAKYKVPPRPKRDEPKPEPQTHPVTQKKNRPTAPPKPLPAGPGYGTVVFKGHTLPLRTCVAEIDDDEIDVVFYPFVVTPEEEKDAATMSMWTAEQHQKEYPAAFRHHPFVTLSIDFKRPNVVSRDNIKRVHLMMYGLEQRNETHNISLELSDVKITRLDRKQVHVELEGEATDLQYHLKGKAKVYRDE